MLNVNASLMLTIIAIKTKPNFFYLFKIYSKSYYKNDKMNYRSVEPIILQPGVIVSIALGITIALTNSLCQMNRVE